MGVGWRREEAAREAASERMDEYPSVVFDRCALCVSRSSGDVSFAKFGANCKFEHCPI